MKKSADSFFPNHKWTNIANNV